MRVLLAGIVAVLALAMPAHAGESCTSQPDSNPGAHPGVVLGPATKCVRDDGTTTTVQVPAGANAKEAPEGPSWVSIAAGGVVLAGFVIAVAQVRRRFDGRSAVRADAA